MDHSPLSGLPAELRNYIYEMALHQDTIVDVHLPDLVDYSPDSWDDRPDSLSVKLEQQRALKFKCSRNPLALTWTCKELQAEAADLFYAVNSFRINLHNTYVHSPYISSVSRRMSRALCPFTTFLDKLGPENVSRLTSITVQLGEKEWGYTHIHSLRDKDTQEAFIGLLRDVKLRAECLPRLQLTLCMVVAGTSHTILDGPSWRRNRDDMELSIDLWPTEKTLERAICNVCERYGKPNLFDHALRDVEETLVKWHEHG